MTAEEIALDLEELRSLRNLAKRPRIQEWIDRKISTLVAEQPAKISETSSPTVSVNKEKSTTPSSLPTVKVTNYGWDESDKFVKVYITLQGVQNANPSSIQHSFTSTGYDIAVSDHGGKNYVMTMKGLRDEIIPESSQLKVKTDMLLVMMKKKNEGKKWEQLTKLEYDQVQKRKPKFDDKIDDDPQASLMNMMKQMYEEGDDEMKRTIRKAWHEGQNKKNTVDPPSFGDL
uniref:Calcyclin-binding protein n=1 Tax=Haemonchus contortus TaxID=6289 RepID=A0A7I4YU84_HAECO